MHAREFDILMAQQKDAMFRMLAWIAAQHGGTLTIPANYRQQSLTLDWSVSVNEANDTIIVKATAK